MAAPNGMNPGPMAPYLPGGGLDPPAGWHADAQHIWRLVQELSNALQANREKYEELKESISRAQIRPQTETLPQPQENGHVNGDGATHSPPPAPTNPDSAAQIALLTNQLTTTQSRLSDTQSQLLSAETLYQDYETFLRKTVEDLHKHAYNTQSHINALHAHYNSLLEQSRNETIQAQLVHQAWQAGLGRLAGGLREAFDEVGEGGMKARAEMAALREENRVLRRLAGWEVEDEEGDSESSSEDEMGVGGIEEMGRGRMGLGLQ